MYNVYVYTIKKYVSFLAVTVTFIVQALFCLRLNGVVFD